MLVAAVLVAVWGFSLIVPIKNLIEERMQEGMVAVANAAAVALQSSDLPASNVLGRIAATDDLRLTLIASDGTVLAESIEDDGVMKNHADRPEVITALSGEVGYDRRVSETDGVEYLYVTVPCAYEGGTTVVRVSRTMKQVNELTTNYLWMSLGLLASALAVAVAAAWFGRGVRECPSNVWRSCVPTLSQTPATSSRRPLPAFVCWRTPSDRRPPTETSRW